MKSTSKGFLQWGGGGISLGGGEKSPSPQGRKVSGKGGRVARGGASCRSTWVATEGILPEKEVGKDQRGGGMAPTKGDPLKDWGH